MKARVGIEKYYEGGYSAFITIDHDLFRFGQETLTTKTHKSKGELKRKVIQFCSQLNLEVEFI